MHNVKKHLWLPLGICLVIKASLANPVKESEVSNAQSIHSFILDVQRGNTSTTCIWGLKMSKRRLDVDGSSSSKKLRDYNDSISNK